MEKLDGKKTLSSDFDSIQMSKTFQANSDIKSQISFASVASERVKDFEFDQQSEGSRPLMQVVDQFMSKTPLQSIITKFCNNKIQDYIFHTKIYLEYDEESAFIFIFKNSLVFTHIFDEKSNVTENPIIYIVKFQQIYFYDLDINETEGNYIIIQFYENDYSKKSEIKLNFNFLKDSYFIHHFIKKYFILHWQKAFEENLLNKPELSSQIYNYHFYIKKLNRWRNLQDRMLLVTNEFMFNIIGNFKKDTFKFEKIRWGDAIASITKIGIIQNNMNEVRIYYDEKLNKEIHKSTLTNSKLYKSKKSRDFMFKSKEEKNYFIFILRKNIFKITDKDLIIEGIKIK